MKPKAPQKSTTAPSLKRNVRKIILVDDHPVMRQGVAELINHEADLTICGQFEDSASAFAAIPELSPDLAMVDLSLKSSSGLELVKNIKATYPNVLVLVFSMHDESLYAERVLRAGASGYIMKQEATERVLAALRRVLGGGIYLS
jgi:DNA-binding NarL/FixJ family response regulator